MTFLPIAERELRVASRKRWTFWTRSAAASVALLIGVVFLLMATHGPFGSGTSSLGSGLFTVLTWLAFAAAVSTGLFVTSDCLSEEKREGTLGLLFLTDLRGYDVVLGKLLASSWQAFLALLAVLPILAVTLIMGGVTGDQFWKTSLAVVNAMFLSLSTGLFVSVISRDSQRALAGTLGLLLLLTASGPLIDAARAGLRQGGFEPLLSLSSPGYLFATAGSWGRTPFWSCFLVNQLLAWGFFSGTCLLIPHTWQERGSRLRTGTQRLGGADGILNRSGGTDRLRRLKDANPVMWLVCRERWQANALWGLTVLLIVSWIAVFAGSRSNARWMLWSFWGGACTLAIYLGVASHAGRLLVDARRSGLMELLLATPVAVQQIIQGLWQAFMRMFGVALILCLVAQMLGTVLVQWAIWSEMAAATAAIPVMPPLVTTNAIVTGSNVVVAPTSTTVTTAASSGAVVSVTVPAGGNRLVQPHLLMPFAVAIAGAFTVVANLVALVWFGMWMGLTSKNASLATLKTIVFVQIIPWFVISILSTMAPIFLLPWFTAGTTTFNPTSITLWYPLFSTGVSTLLCLVKDLAFSLWARGRLYSEFRERAARTGAAARPPRPPPLPSASANAAATI